MITINLSHYDRETEIAITQAKSGVSRPDVERIVDIVRDFRETKQYEFAPTVRACVMIGKVLNLCRGHAVANDENFTQACLDVLGSEAMAEISRVDAGRPRIKETVIALIRKHCEGKPRGGEFIIAPPYFEKLC